jgi:2-iminobutanoate/2-iminopropanoate deaminase
MHYRTNTLLAAALLLSLSTFAADPTYHPFPGDRSMPLSDAVQVGDMLYLSGKLGFDRSTGKLVAGGIGAETRQTMEAIKASLENYGSSLDRVVKCTVFLADMGEWAAMNEVYGSYFPKNPPARSALGASGLALGARVEIECMAAMAN